MVWQQQDFKQIDFGTVLQQYKIVVWDINTDIFKLQNWRMYVICLYNATRHEVWILKQFELIFPSCMNKS